MATRNWRTFDGKHALSEIKAPQLSIQRGGTLGINKSLYEALGRPDRIVFLWDVETRTFGLSTHIEGARSTYPVRAQQSESSWVINATSFLRWAGVSHGDKVQYYNPIIEDGIAIIELDQERSGETDGKGDK